MPATETDFRFALGVQAAPMTVREAVSTSAGVSGWWFPTTALGEDRLQVARGGSAVELWVCTDGEDVVWDVLDCPGEPDWVGTRVRFSVIDGGEVGSTVAFTHHGLAVLPCLKVCTAGWAQYLPNLASYLESRAVAQRPTPPQNQGDEDAR